MSLDGHVLWHVAPEGIAVSNTTIHVERPPGCHYADE